jgi:hypothetical protein
VTGLCHGMAGHPLQYSNPGTKPTPRLGTTQHPELCTDSWHHIWHPNFQHSWHDKTQAYQHPTAHRTFSHASNHGLVAMRTLPALRTAHAQCTCCPPSTHSNPNSLMHYGVIHSLFGLVLFWLVLAHSLSCFLHTHLSNSLLSLLQY